MPRREPSADQPLTEAEVARLFRLFEGRRVALAVSGGLDSTVLLHLVARWLGTESGTAWRDAWIAKASCSSEVRDARPIIVLTVDHALRTGSAQEATAVACAAEKLGLPHRTLVWRRAASQTTTALAGLQEKARAARYQLMADAIATADCWAGRRSTGTTLRRHTLVTAHHRDDQIETFLMRLSRGAGIDGLSAMHPLAVLDRTGSMLPEPHIEICRPLLDVPRSRLAATAKAMGLGWSDDPSNANQRFERVRWRQAAQQLEALGLSAAALHTSIKRLRRARAIVHRHQRLEADGVDATHRRLIMHGGLYAEINISRWRDDGPGISPDLAHRELVTRLLARAIGDCGGGELEPGLAQIESLADDLLAHARLSVPALPASGDGRVSAVARLPAHTLGGCRIDGRIDAARMTAVIRVWREAGRNPLPSCELRPGEGCIWDARFLIAADKQAPAANVAALGVNGWAILRRRVPAISRWRHVPPGAAATLPAIWVDGKMVSVPTLLTPLVTISPQLASTIAAEVAEAYRAKNLASQPLWTAHLRPQRAVSAADEPFLGQSNDARRS